VFVNSGTCTNLIQSYCIAIVITKLIIRVYQPTLVLKHKSSFIFLLSILNEVDFALVVQTKRHA